MAVTCNPSSNLNYTRSCKSCDFKLCEGHWALRQTVCLDLMTKQTAVTTVWDIVAVSHCYVSVPLRVRICPDVCRFEISFCILYLYRNKEKLDYIIIVMSQRWAASHLCRYINEHGIVIVCRQTFIFSLLISASYAVIWHTSTIQVIIYCFIHKGYINQIQFWTKLSLNSHIVLVT